MADQSLIDYYDRRLPRYDAIYRIPERAADLEELRCWVEHELAGRRVLEVACGTGYWTELVARRATVIATDRSRNAVGVARRAMGRHERIRFAVADASRPPVAAGPCTGGFAAFWWSHVSRDQLDAFVQAFHTALPAGARVMFIDNRYVAGKSTPLAGEDAAGNTLQDRRLDDGSIHCIIKNFPTRHEVEAVLEPAATDVQMREWTYYWGVAYSVREG